LETIFELSLSDRDRTIEDLNLRLRELAGLPRKEQAARESQTDRITTQEAFLARGRPSMRTRSARTPTTSKKGKIPSEEALICAAARVPQTLAKEIQRSILVFMTFVLQNQQQSNQRSSRAAVFVCVCGML
jgi:hypothetical protein